MATDYGKRLKEARASADMTQAQLSKLTGIPQSTISTAERMGHGSSDTAVYAKALGVDPTWLATGEGDIKTQSSWPFKKIAYERFMALDADDRAACQHELLSAIEKLEARALQQRKTGS